MQLEGLSVVNVIIKIKNKKYKMASEKIQFSSLAELNNPTLAQEVSSKEFAEQIPVEEFIGNTSAMDNVQTSRRDFLKFLGFSTAAVTLAACQEPIIKSVPFVVKPEGIIPGIPNYYATTFFDGSDYANVLVKTREGRPIKIEANKGANLFGKTNPRAQASVLSLYDNNRIQEPSINGQNVSWDKIDQYVIKALSETVAEGKSIYILTPSLPSPSTLKLIEEFSSKYTNTKHVVFDLLSNSAALDASFESFGQRALPLYDLSTTELVVSFNADFLNSWNGNSLEESYAKAKKPSDKMIRHIQVEGNFSMTGASADQRIPMKPSVVYKTLAEVYTILNGGNGSAEAKKIAKELATKGSKAVVFADGNKDAHIIANAINQKLGSEALSKNKMILLKQSNDVLFNTFVSDMNAGSVGVVLNFETNPLYASENSKAVETGFKKVKHTIALTQKNHETTSKMKVIAPVPHWLECWGDINPATGVYSLQQPTIQRIFNTRQFQDSLLKWMGTSTPVVAGVSTKIAAVKKDSLGNTIPVIGSNTPTVKENNFYNYLRENWENFILSLVDKESFNKALYDGFNAGNESTSVTFKGNPSESVSKLISNKGSDFELQLYTKVALGDGTQANNPWLQELPDPITRASWDNYMLIHPKDAEKLGLENSTNGRMQLNGDLAKVTVNGQTIEIPVFIQVGQAKGCIGIALGYGQKGSGKVAETGVNAYSLFKNSTLDQYGVSITKSDADSHEFACIQMQNTLMGRYEIAREVDLKTYLNSDIKEWNAPLEMESYGGALPISSVDLYDEFDSSDGPKFNLSVDMNSCTGCGACVIACQAENNVPVVGKEEIRRSRDMYWLRIDRYYTSQVPPGADTNKDGKLSQPEAFHDEYNEPQQYSYLINPLEDNPEVIFQPVMCQHCNHAPCETVCPVAATSHGKQGQNQMAYNRCVGTRYCANNCPYKVRRFNWLNYALNDKFDFNMNNDLGRMVLNPDVVVRTRGVMEKCSMCIQMTQATILEAKKDGREIIEGELQTACTKACSSGSLQFGDINKKDSNINKLKKDKRKYELLEDVGTKPNVFYHYKVRNKV